MRPSRVALVSEPIPMVCTIADICRLLHVSHAQFFALRKAGRFPIPEIEPRLDRRPRFSGDAVRQYIDGARERVA